MSHRSALCRVSWRGTLSDMDVQNLPQELERLASRLALIVAGDAEAEAAARAAGQLARRLGLSGGQIKAIFLAGIRTIAFTPGLSEGTERRPGTALVLTTAGREAEGEQEARELRQLLDQTDQELQTARRKAELLRDENLDLRQSLGLARDGARMVRLSLLVLVVTILGSAGVAWFGYGLRLEEARGPASPALVRMAHVGTAGTVLFAEPDRGAEQIAKLPPGTPVPVRQLLWRDLTQWVETETDGQVGYAPATSIELR